jgi:hypothetical protein
MWTAHGVQIDGMREFPVLSVFQVQLDGITQPHAQEWSGYRALEGPEFILHTVSQRRTFFDGFEFNDHLGRSAAGSGRRDIGGWNQFSFDHRRRDGPCEGCDLLGCYGCDASKGQRGNYFYDAKPAPRAVPDA